MKQKVHIEAQLNMTETGPHSAKEFKGKVERDLFITGSPLGVEHFSDFDGFSDLDGNQNFVDIDPKGEKWAQAVSQNFDLECVDTPDIDGLRYVSNQDMVIYEKDNATFENEEVKECADENILFSDEDPTTIGKYKVEECVDEKILFSDEDPTTNNKEEAEVWNDVKHCQAAQSTQRFACRRQTILMLRSNQRLKRRLCRALTRVQILCIGLGTPTRTTELPILFDCWLGLHIRGQQRLSACVASCIREGRWEVAR